MAKVDSEREKQLREAEARKVEVKESLKRILLVFAGAMAARADIPIPQGTSTDDVMSVLKRMAAPRWMNAAVIFHNGDYVNGRELRILVDSDYYEKTATETYHLESALKSLDQFDVPSFYLQVQGFITGIGEVSELKRRLAKAEEELKMDRPSMRGMPHPMFMWGPRF